MGNSLNKNKIHHVDNFSSSLTLTLKNRAPPQIGQSPTPAGSLADMYPHPPPKGVQTNHRVFRDRPPARRSHRGPWPKERAVEKRSPTLDGEKAEETGDSRPERLSDGYSHGPLGITANAGWRHSPSSLRLTRDTHVPTLLNIPRIPHVPPRQIAPTLVLAKRDFFCSP